MTDEFMCDSDRKPVLIIAAGRQRVSKTVFLNASAQYMKEQGSNLVL